MDVGNLAKLEALLFTSPEPVSPGEIARAADMSESEVRKYLKILTREFDKKSHGIQVKEYNDRYFFVTKPEFSSYIKSLHNKPGSIRLSQAALETLAIIAYKQPITRAEIEEIRGG